MESNPTLTDEKKWPINLDRCVGEILFPRFFERIAGVSPNPSNPNLKESAQAQEGDEVRTAYPPNTTVFKLAQPKKRIKIVFNLILS